MSIFCISSQQQYSNIYSGTSHNGIEKLSNFLRLPLAVQFVVKWPVTGSMHYYTEVREIKIRGI